MSWIGCHSLSGISPFSFMITSIPSTKGTSLCSRKYLSLDLCKNMFFKPLKQEECVKIKGIPINHEIFMFHGPFQVNHECLSKLIKQSGFFDLRIWKKISFSIPSIFRNIFLNLKINQIYLSACKVFYYVVCNQLNCFDLCLPFFGGICHLPYTFHPRVPRVKD